MMCGVTVCMPLGMGFVFGADLAAAAGFVPDFAFVSVAFASVIVVSSSQLRLLDGVRAPS
jgi:hypothetical protein